MLKKIKNKPKGFTLMEVMVATFLMAGMGILLMTSLNTSVNAKENVEHVLSAFKMCAKRCLACLARFRWLI